MWMKSQAALLAIAAAFAVAGFTQPREVPVERRAVAGEASAGPALRIKEDRARGRRWELGWGFASAYDLASGERIRTIRFPRANLSGSPATCVPDMLLSRTGALIVSSNAEPSLWRISPSRFELERFDIELDSDREKDFGFTGLAWGADENVLYAVSAVMGTLWRIDLNSSTAKKVELSTPVRGACGLSLVPGEARGRRAPSLLVTMGENRATERISLSPDLARGEVTREP